MPEGTDQTDEDSIQEFDEEYVANTEIREIQTASIPVSSRKVTAITLYTLRTEVMAETSSMTYCMKSELKLDGNDWRSARYILITPCKVKYNIHNVQKYDIIYVRYVYEVVLCVFEK